MTSEVQRLTVVTGASTGTGRVRRRVMSVVAHALLIGASILMLYPLLWMLSASFRPENEIFSSRSLIPSSVSLHGYVSGWFGLSQPFSTFFLNSLTISILCVIGNLAACSLTAFAFARLEFRGKRFWFALMLGTLMLPYQVTLIPQYVLFLNLGWVDSYLPLIVPRFLAGDAFFIFLMIQFFRQLPRELDEAAMIDGCSPFKIYWAIIMPLSLPAMATAAIFSFIWTWEDFLGPLVYLNDMKDYTVPLALRSFISQDGVSQYGPMFAMSILSILPIVLFFVVFQRLIIRGIAMSGLK